MATKYFYAGNTPAEQGGSNQFCGVYVDESDKDPGDVFNIIMNDLKIAYPISGAILTAFNKL